MKGPITATHQKYLQRCLDQLAGNSQVTMEDKGADTGYRLEFSSHYIWHNGNTYVWSCHYGMYEVVNFKTLCKKVCQQLLEEKLSKVTEPISKKVAATVVLHGIYGALTGEESDIYDIICDGHMMEFSVQVNDEESVRVCLKPEHFEGCFVKKCPGDTIPE